MLDHRDPEAYNAWKRNVFSRLQVETGSGVVSYLDGVEGDGVRPPNVAQQELHWSDWRFFVAALGVRSGKTLGAAAEGTALLGIPKKRIWVVAPNYELTDRTFSIIWKWVVEDKIYGDNIVEKSFVRDRRIIRMKWGSVILGKSAKNPESLLGDQIDLALLDEAARLLESVWNRQVRARLADRRGKAIFASTPQGMNWFYDYFQRRLERDLREEGWNGITMKSEDNPFMSHEEIDQIRRVTPEADFRREYEASFEHFTGLIWDMFRDRIYDPKHPGRGGHVVRPGDIPGSGSNYRGIDIGWRHPTACIWGRAVPPRNDLYIYRAYLGDDKDHKGHAAEIRSKTQESIVDSWISPDSKRKNPDSHLSAWDAYQDQGIWARIAIDAVKSGCDLVSAYLLSTLSSSPNHPKMFVSSECKELIKAIQSYRYAEVSETSSLSAPERPHKYKDDMADALRYLCAGRPAHIPASEMGDMNPMLEDDNVRYGYPKRRVKANRSSIRIAGLE